MARLPPPPSGQRLDPPGQGAPVSETRRLTLRPGGAPQAFNAGACPRRPGASAALAALTALAALAGPTGPWFRPRVRTQDQTALPKAVMVAVVSVISTASASAGWPSSPGMVSVTWARMAAGWAHTATARMHGIAAAGVCGIAAPPFCSQSRTTRSRCPVKCAKCSRDRSPPRPSRR